MREIVYSPRAEVDLQEIWHFTATRWNVGQADRYIEQLLATCSALAEGIVFGRSADDIQAGYRKQSSGSHDIFFQESSEEVVIIRVLHKRMDASSHFDEPN